MFLGDNENVVLGPLNRPVHVHTCPENRKKYIASTLGSVLSP